MGESKKGQTFGQKHCWNVEFFFSKMSGIFEKNKTEFEPLQNKTALGILWDEKNEIFYEWESWD